MLSKIHKPDNFESHDSLKPSFTKIGPRPGGALCSNFVGFEPSLELNSSDILALYETNLDKI